MKTTTSYLYVATLGMASGVAFSNAYEIEDLHTRANADLPEPVLIEKQRRDVNQNGTTTATRLADGFRRWVRQPLWRKAAKPDATA